MRFQMQSFFNQPPSDIEQVFYFLHRSSAHVAKKRISGEKCNEKVGLTIVTFGKSWMPLSLICWQIGTTTSAMETRVKKHGCHAMILS